MGFALRDHPRIRGEHVDHARHAPGEAGSSPHTRGAPSKSRPGGSATRIIPAYAGSTSSKSAQTSPLRDHPRIRGEHPRRALRSLGRRGSSPHTRGAPSSGPPTTTRRTDHPRIRGEHRLSGLYTGDGQGSSPHTRGARLRGARRHQERRIIPAYAGSTSRQLTETSSP